ncbi:hypothetical protein PGTUg99_027252 [Puccinia graminis f. sp. tritici]|uniref:Uncharacterized protein n=1 Tax=Puccinia graminis f. sp. tritici TaxID=56615 RepID=A0A5B0QLU3_PUCGR|nr:hypothetical protein PGTUg99_027252 [Puccinia graminis f. sp. tritici]
MSEFSSETSQTCSEAGRDLNEFDSKPVLASHWSRFGPAIGGNSHDMVRPDYSKSEEEEKVLKVIATIRELRAKKSGLVIDEFRYPASVKGSQTLIGALLKGLKSIRENSPPFQKAFMETDHPKKEFLENLEKVDQLILIHIVYILLIFKAEHFKLK